MKKIGESKAVLHNVDAGGVRNIDGSIDIDQDIHKQENTSLEINSASCENSDIDIAPDEKEKNVLIHSKKEGDTSGTCSTQEGNISAPDLERDDSEKEEKFYSLEGGEATVSTFNNIIQSSVKGKPVINYTYVL